MRLLTPFDPTATSSGRIITQLVNQGSKIIVMNESSINLLLTFGDGTTAQLPANWARLFILVQPHFDILWQQQSSGGISSIQPTNQVVVEVYEPYEMIVEHYPQELLRQTNAGNQGAGASTLADDGRAGGATPVTIEATQSGAGGSNVLIDNQGNATFAQWSSGILTTIFHVLANATSGTDNVKLGDSGHQVYIQGTLLADLATTFSGDVTVNGLGTGLSVANNVTVSGTATVSIDLALALGSVSKIASFGPYSIAGNGHGTFAHNLGVIPDFILLVIDDTTYHQLPSVDFANLTSSQFTSYNGGGGTATFRGIAIKF